MMMILYLSHGETARGGLLADTEDADARIVGTRGQVSEECLLGFHHLAAVLLEARCVEEVEAVVMPDGDAKVAGVESGFVGDEADDIAVVYTFTELGVFEAALGNVGDGLAKPRLFLLGDGFHPFGMLAEHIVTVGMGAHIVDAEALTTREEGGWRVDLLDESPALIFAHPPLEIV